jgi:acetolactate synthase-1/2/3 large subunit
MSRFATGAYVAPKRSQHKSYRPQVEGRRRRDRRGGRDDRRGRAPDLLHRRRRHQRRPRRQRGAAPARRAHRRAGHLDADGPRRLPVADEQWLGMLGMHGTYEANMAMHDCADMINIGARFDDRITGRLDAFSPRSKKIHIDIDPLDQQERPRRPRIVGDCAACSSDGRGSGRRDEPTDRQAALGAWWTQIDGWRANALPRLQEGPARTSCRIRAEAALFERPRTATPTSPPRSASTRCGRRSISASQEPNRWMTSGGLGTMGYGLPAAIGVQIEAPRRASSSTSRARPRS